MPDVRALAKNWEENTGFPLDFFSCEAEEVALETLILQRRMWVILVSYLV